MIYVLFFLLGYAFARLALLLDVPWGIHILVGAVVGVAAGSALIRLDPRI